MSEIFMVATHSQASFSSVPHEIKGGRPLFMNSKRGRWFTSLVQVGWPLLGLHPIRSSSFAALM
jgi:hypothetical protein